MKKAYKVFTDDSECTEIVFAENRGKAKIESKLYRNGEASFIELSCRRAKEFDDLEGDEEKILLKMWKCCWHFNATSEAPDPEKATNEEFLDWYFKAEWM